MAYVNISETSEFTENVKKPQDLIDGVTVASLLASVQPLVNRTRWLYNKVVGGVDRVRGVADVATMKALAGVSDGDLCRVTSVGVFMYSAATVTSTDYPYAYSSTGMGAGSWVTPVNGCIGQPGGIAQLTTSGRLTQRTQFPEVVSFDVGTLPGVNSATSGTVVQSWFLGSAAGDKICLDVSGILSTLYVDPQYCANLVIETSTDGIAWYGSANYSAPHFSGLDMSGSGSIIVQAQAKSVLYATGASSQFRVVLGVPPGVTASLTSVGYSIIQVRP